MMTAKEGYIEITGNNPELKCVEAYDNGDSYLYYIIPKYIDPKEYIGGPMLYGIQKKSKKIFEINFLKILPELSKMKKVKV